MLAVSFFVLSRLSSNPLCFEARLEGDILLQNSETMSCYLNDVLDWSHSSRTGLNRFTF